MHDTNRILTLVRGNANSSNIIQPPPSVTDLPRIPINSAGKLSGRGSPTSSHKLNKSRFASEQLNVVFSETVLEEENVHITPPGTPVIDDRMPVTPRIEAKTPDASPTLVM